MSGGYSLDAAATRFSFDLEFTDASGGATTIDNLKYIFLHRGPNSIINRFQLYDQSGQLLEDLQNYHLVYRLEKVCTGDASIKRFRNSVFKECRNMDSVAAAIAGITVSLGAGAGSLAKGLFKVGAMDPSHGEPCSKESLPITPQPPFL